MTATVNAMDLHLKELTISARGVKSAAVVNAKGDAVSYTFDDFTMTPFGPSSFDKDPQATRQQLDVRLGSAEPFFQNLDNWAIAYISEHSERLFRKKLSAEQITERYHPCVRTSEKHPSLLRTKINLGGNNFCLFWNSKEELVEAPESWKIEFRPRVDISHLWVMGSSCGLVLTCSHLLLAETKEVAFPF